ncbi:MAG TPA: tyrosine-type recombinase/integrase [Stellaceae bacterium]|nr:tyrosine-type recombinase/integrase [Stellaceae bacterium]
MQFTDLSIRGAKPPQEGYAYMWDSSLRGFGLRISARGTKTFCVLIGRGRRQTIGRYPLICLADARTEAKRILAEKTLGRVRPTHTAFEDARDAFLKECETRLRPITVKLYRRHLSTHFVFGRSSVGDITPREIVRNLNKLNDRPGEKEHAHRVGRTFFRWCVGQHIIDRSPMETVAKPPIGVPRERVLSEDELRAVYGTAHRLTSAFHRLVCLLIHTGCRRGELTRLQWAHIASDTITIPAEITKNKRTHAFPIGPRTQALIEILPRIDGNRYVFPASREHVKGKPTTVMTGYSEAKRDFDTECGVVGWTLHDLRRTFSTGLADLDVAPHIIERLLNHVSGEISEVAAIYNRSKYIRPMREAVEKWENHLASL